MYDGSRSVSFYLSAPYFVFLVFFGQIIMINLFLAILLGNFGASRSNIMKSNKIYEIEEYLKIGKLPMEAVMELGFGEYGKHMHK